MLVASCTTSATSGDEILVEVPDEPSESGQSDGVHQQQLLSFEPSIPDQGRWGEGQDRVFACMAEEGFDYLAVPYPTELESFVPLDHRGDEWIASFGLGVTTRYYSTPVVEAHGLVGRDESEAVDQSPPTDPNEELLAGLLPGERQAWEEALYGAASTLEPTEEQIEAGVVPVDGCHALTLYSSDEADFYLENAPLIEDIQVRLEAHPRYIEQLEMIGECVRFETGLSPDQFPDLAAYESSLLERLRMTLANDYAERVFAEAEDSGVDSREAFDEYVQSGRAVLNTEEAAILRQLQTEEFAVVGAYQEECGGAELPALRTELKEEITPLVLEEYGF